MTKQRVSRWMGPIGLAILILFVVGFAVLGGNNSPGGNASGEKVITYWNAHQTIGWAQIPVIGLGLGLFMLFVSQLRDVLGDSDQRGPLPRVAYAAGIIFVADLVAAGGFLHVPLLLAAHNHQAAIAQTLNFLDQNNELILLFGMALLTLSTGLAILTGSPLPRWLGWVSIVIGVVCCAGPFFFFGLLAGAIWIPVAGFVVAAKAKTAVQTA